MSFDHGSNETTSNKTNEEKGWDEMKVKNLNQLIQVLQKISRQRPSISQIGRGYLKWST